LEILANWKCKLHGIANFGDPLWPVERDSRLVLLRIQTRFAGLYRIAPGVLYALVIVKTETVIRWHRAGILNKDAPISNVASSE
jgi:hypothetical protein